MQSKNTPASRIALGGLLASVSVILMCIGTVIPVFTYSAPVLCILVGQIVWRLCGSRIAWAWYGAVMLLSLLLAPDKEAAMVFAVLGYYPFIKPKLDGRKAGWLLKLLLFNGSILLLYWLLLNVIGMTWLMEDFSGVGIGMMLVMILLGNITFFLLDFLLAKELKRKR